MLLPVNEVKIWINHLQSVIENRRRGARKAAATRQSKKKLAVSQASVSESNSVSSPLSCYCGQCGLEYIEETEELESWVACDLCEHWYHFSCENIVNVPTEEIYICMKCKK